MTQEQIQIMLAEVSQLVQERDEALAEVEQLKAYPTRLEPSRLEIAAAMMAANLSRETDQWETTEEAIWAIEQADILIAAAKEGK